MRSFFSTLLLSNWAFLLFLLLTAVGVLYLDTIINPELRVILFFVYFLIAMFGSFYISYSIAQIVTEPLKQIEKKTDEINAGDFGTVLIQPEIRELAKLANSINEMSQRLKSQFVDLTLEKDKFNSLLQNLKEGVFAVDLQKNLLFQNQNLPHSLLPPGTKNMDSTEGMVHPELRKVLEEAIHSKIEKNSIIFSNNHYYNIRIYPLKSQDYIYIYIGVILDITEQKQNELIREQFFQNASHELKTPITSIKGFAETLQARLNFPEDSQEKKFLEAILRNTDRMIRIIEDMLLISKLENPSTVIQKERFQLRNVLENISISLLPILDKKNQKLILAIDPDSYIEADPLLLEHLTINLISNASSYSPENTQITIRYSKKNQKNFLCFEDEGYGIPPEESERIFERFYRIDSNRSRKEGGTGLGLSIVKHICKLHQWDIQVIPNHPRGSIFQISWV